MGNTEDVCACLSPHALFTLARPGMLPMYFQSSHRYPWLVHQGHSKQIRTSNVPSSWANWKRLPSCANAAAKAALLMCLRCHICCEVLRSIQKGLLGYSGGLVGFPCLQGNNNFPGIPRELDNCHRCFFFIFSCKLTANLLVDAERVSQGEMCIWFRSH